jgi:WD40 repeat protein
LEGNTVRLRDLLNGEIMKSFTGTKYLRLYAATQLDDGSIIAGGEIDNYLYAWNIQRDEIVTPLPGHSSAVLCILQLHNGNIVSSANDGTIILWDRRSLSKFLEIKLDSSSIYRMIQKDDKTLVCAGFNGIVFLLNPNSGETITKFSINSSYITALEVLQDGRIAYGGGYRHIFISDISNPYEPVHHTMGPTLSGDICQIVQLKDGRLITRTRDGCFTIWNIQTEEEICHMRLNLYNDDWYPYAIVDLGDGQIVCRDRDSTVIWIPGKTNNIKRVLKRESSDALQYRGLLLAKLTV